MIFPTAGRSAAVMVGIREELRALRPRNVPAQPSERAVVASDSNGHAESIKDWAEARRLRQIGEMRGRASGTFEFNGPKRDALVRFLRRSAAQGRTIIVVMPESPFYREAFVTADVQRRFEALLAEAQRRVPEAVWVRLDTVPELQAKEYYWDLIHLNAPGQALATQRLLAQLAAAKIAR